MKLVFALAIFVLPYFYGCRSETSITDNVTQANDGHYRFNYAGSNQSCILMDISSLVFVITYPLENDQNKTVLYNATAMEVDSGLSSCGYNLTENELEEVLAFNIPFKDAKLQNAGILLKLYFTRDATITGDKTLGKVQVYKMAASYTYDPAIFPGIATARIDTTETVFSSGILNEVHYSKDHSYQCKAETSVKVSDKFTFRVSGLRAQAFVANDGFDAPQSCPADLTTTAPTTTTSLAPATTMKPADGHFRFNYTDNQQYCIMMDVSSLELEITYPLEAGNETTLTFKAPPTTQVSDLSKCGRNFSEHELNETLALSIPLNDNLLQQALLLKFFFTRDPSITGDKSLDKSQVYKIEATYTYDPSVFIGVQQSLIHRPHEDISNGTLKEFSVLKDRSYQCNSETSLKVTDELTLKFKGLRTQAFIANDRFDAPDPCPADAKTSDVVPIVIGAVLAAIVLLVLIAYLIGRARMRRTTYESI